jgi:nitrile hydratase accessory protein
MSICGTTTLSGCEKGDGKDGPATLPGLPKDNDGPVFAEPWQAQAFALTVKLHEDGRFTWAEWAETLAAEITRAQAAGDPDDGSTYYHHWLAALERISVTKGLATPTDLEDRRCAWETAHRTTPHGKPVKLTTSDN